MKILYAIQTTGNGHLARAQNIIPKIKEVAELEICLLYTSDAADE